MAALRGIYIIWLRDILRFWRNKLRLFVSFVQPMLFLFILGSGLASSFKPMGSSTSFVKFMYPGIICMIVLFSSIFSAMSIVWDREFGFLKEVLAAPIPRTSVVIGKILGGSTTAMIQGLLMILLAPAIGIKFGTDFSFLSLIKVILFMILIALSLTSLGILIASRITKMESFMVVMNLIVMPLFFLSGAMFPLKGLPKWMDVLTKINPLTYGVDSLRYFIIRQQVYSTLHNFTIITIFCLLMIILAIFAFGKQE